MEGGAGKVEGQAGQVEGRNRGDLQAVFVPADMLTPLT